MIFNTASLNAQENYKLLVGGVTPRPIAWISTMSREGVANIAPYSFFNVASCHPPVLWYSQVNPADAKDKDTLNNLIETKACVINIANSSLLEKMNRSSASIPSDQSEFDFAEIATCPSHSVKPLSVLHAPIRYECELREVIRLGTLPMSGSAVLLDVKSIYVSDDIWKDAQISQNHLDSVGKMGGDFFSLTTQLVQMSRP